MPLETLRRNSMEQSILKTIKQLIGCPDDFEQFDLDLTIHINSAFATLTHLGVGPKEGYRITGVNNVWSEFEEDTQKLSLIKDYVYIKTRLLFDPPTSSSLMDSLKEQLKEMEWRLYMLYYPVSEDDEKGKSDND
jgi:hypothetical protein